MKNPSTTRVRWVIAGLCVLSAIRVFVFAAAFPFFNNVDEQAHVDLMLKYAHGRPPHGIEPFSREAALYFAVYSTPEYFVKPEQYGGQFPPPNWLLPRDQLEKVVQDEVPFWESRFNHESGEPPLYYSAAGSWFDLGTALGLNGVRLLYWVRFLNIAFAAGLVWLGFIATRKIFPDSPFLQLAVPMLLAVWPQSAFYSIQADALSPVVFGIAFLGLIEMLKSDRPGVVVVAWSGLALAATCLIKTSNLPLPVITTIVLALKFFVGTKDPDLKSELRTLGIFVFSFALPIGLWFGWNYHYFGDLTATQSKIKLLDWTPKPFPDWWSHPIFTFHGVRQFWSELSASFWRGETVWYLERMASPLADAFYVISSAIVILVTIILLCRRGVESKQQRFILWLALLTFASLAGFLVLLSISFDFGRCPYPSRDDPYFVSGRLLSAGAIPFFLLFAYVIDRFGSWTKRHWTRWTLLCLTVVVAIVSQLHVNAPAFASQYNFFHRPAQQ